MYGVTWYVDISTPKEPVASISILNPTLTHYALKYWFTFTPKSDGVKTEYVVICHPQKAGQNHNILVDMNPLHIWQTQILVTEQNCIKL